MSQQPRSVRPELNEVPREIAELAAAVGELPGASDR